MVRDLSESWEYLHAISNVCRWFSRSFAQLVHYIIIIISILLLLSSLWLCGWVSAYVYYYWFLCYLKFFLSLFCEVFFFSCHSLFLLSYTLYWLIKVFPNAILSGIGFKCHCLVSISILIPFQCHHLVSYNFALFFF